MSKATNGVDATLLVDLDPRTHKDNPVRNIGLAFAAGLAGLVILVQASSGPDGLGFYVLRVTDLIIEGFRKSALFILGTLTGVAINKLSGLGTVVVHVEHGTMSGRRPKRYRYIPRSMHVDGEYMVWSEKGGFLAMCHKAFVSKDKWLGQYTIIGDVRRIVNRGNMTIMYESKDAEATRDFQDKQRIRILSYDADRRAQQNVQAQRKS